MKFGISLMPTDYSVAPTELAIAVEQRGFESLWFPEHTHIPTSRKSPFPGGELPEAYKKILDPFLALAAAAAVTRRIKLATGICLVVERDPIHNAKEVATLDLLSGGTSRISFEYSSSFRSTSSRPAVWIRSTARSIPAPAYPLRSSASG